jgi:hypothetical protein
MANYDRSDDVRVFDGGDDEEDVESSRLPLLIVIALFVIAAFGAVVWLAYQRGVAQGHSDVPRVIAAEPGPARTAPDNPGGTPTPYTGLKIYQQPAPSDAESDAAAPETATAPAKPEAKPATPETKPAAPPAATAPKPVAMAPETKPATPPPAKPAAVETKPVAPPPAKPEAAPAAPTTGGSLLQIGSYKSEADAKTAWAAYRAKHASLVGGLSTDIQKVDLGAKGTWYRLRIVAGSKSDAASLCSKLTADGGACIPAR